MPARPASDLKLRNLHALDFIGKRHKASAQVALLPPSGELPLGQPLPVATAKLKIRRGTAELDLPGLPEHGAFVVNVRR